MAQIFVFLGRPKSGGPQESLTVVAKTFTLISEILRGRLKNQNSGSNGVLNSLQISRSEQKVWHHPLMNNKDVHLWFVDLSASNFIIDRLYNVLSGKERCRAENFKFEKDRARYIVAHVALRQILGGYLEADPSRLEFLESPQGKPELILRPGWVLLKFNLSHSHEAALVAVARGREIGVDIEYIKREFKWQEVAEQFFAPGEVAQLRALPADEQQRAFFTCWT